MDARRQGVLAIVVVALLALAATHVREHSASVSAAGPVDTARITEADIAAVAQFAPEVAPADRAWIEAAIAAARPEAKALIDRVDGLVVFRTVPGGDPLGLTHVRFVGDIASFTIDFNVGELDGRRVQDRNVVVLHELGHVIDHALVPRALGESLDAAIPPAGGCVQQQSVPLAGDCTEPAERFADTFAKWALRGAVSAAGAGYGVPNPPSIEDWGAPLVKLAY